MIYIFDIDGTLTPSRNPIDKKFKNDFLNFCKYNKVWLITGSDKDKSIEQIGEDTWLAVDRAYQCSGNQVWSKGELIRQSNWECPDYLVSLLESFLERNSYILKNTKQEKDTIIIHSDIFKEVDGIKMENLYKSGFLQGKNLHSGIDTYSSFMEQKTNIYNQD